MRLTKTQSRERWSQVRALWSEFDPIGVMQFPDTPLDEHDSYLGATLRLLESDAALEVIDEYLTSAVLGHMGLSDTPAGRAASREFARKLKAWYQGNWQGSTV